MNHFKLALRQFQKYPGFAATILLPISLGIAANCLFCAQNGNC
jgi:hypothetical protein